MAHRRPPDPKQHESANPLLRGVKPPPPRVSSEPTNQGGNPLLSRGVVPPPPRGSTLPEAQPHHGSNPLLSRGVGPPPPHGAPPRGSPAPPPQPYAGYSRGSTPSSVDEGREGSPGPAALPGGGITLTIQALAGT